MKWELSYNNKTTKCRKRQKNAAFPFLISYRDLELRKKGVGKKTKKSGWEREGLKTHWPNHVNKMANQRKKDDGDDELGQT